MPTTATPTTTPRVDASSIHNTHHHDAVAAYLADLDASIRDNPPFTDPDLDADPAADTLDWADR